MNNKTLDKLLDWPKINQIICSQSDNPHETLGPHAIGNHILYQLFYPGAVSAKLRRVADKTEYNMQKICDEGYFACLVNANEAGEYHYIINDGLNNEIFWSDSYCYSPLITKNDTDKFNNGIHYKIYEKLGAHPCVLDRKEGTYFAVWAPNAIRVSVVGDFNHWDGRIHQMRRLWDSGIFEIFIPQANSGMNYKFEIKTLGGLTYLKSDPYGNYAEIRPCSASVIKDITNFTWEDAEFISKRADFQNKNTPINIYELYLGSFMGQDDKDCCINYRNIVSKLIAYIKKMHYTHVQLMPIMEHPYDPSWGYQVIGYYAPTSRYGTPDDFMYFINELHKEGIGVILDWVPAHFPKDGHGLSCFDGTCLYEHFDSRQSEQAFWGTKIFNYARHEVSNYLLANALFWIEKYHIDGIHVGAVASMLYLDYGKQEGDWVANIYGGNENLASIDFLKHFNSIIKKKHPGVITIAEEDSAYPFVTAGLSDGGLGFDYKWNNGFTNDYFEYIQKLPFDRSQHLNDLTFSTIYAYSENFILPFSHDDVVHGKGSIISKMPGNEKDKFANLRLSYAYRMLHPGKKLLFMGQDFGDFKEWNETYSIPWDLLDNPLHKGISKLCEDLNKLYICEEAMHYYDNQKEGFEWINVLKNDNCCLSFIRKGTKNDECLLVTVNLSDKALEYRTGVPFRGTAKELLNTDHAEYGGTGIINSKEILAEEITCDDKPFSVSVNMAPFSMCIFKFLCNNQ